MVYTFLPFAILPIYAAAEKFDFRLIEAARDLGARPLRGLPPRLPARHPPGPAHGRPGRLHPGPGLLRHPRHRRRPGQRDARQQDRPARLRRPQPAPARAGSRSSSSWPCSRRCWPSWPCSAKRPGGAASRRGAAVKRSRFPCVVTGAGPGLLLPADPDPGRRLLQRRRASAAPGGGSPCEWYAPAVPRAGHLGGGPRTRSSSPCVATFVSLVLGTTAALRPAPLRQLAPAALPLHPGLHAARGPRDPDGHQPAAWPSWPPASSWAC
ncbi:MAG: hypothetical protein MZU84_06325 [Sphingobacterium sp.]|nr:hypothetical protein [Sphingobacterium sp.]